MFINYDYEYEYQQQVITCKQIAITIAKTIASKKYKKLRQKATEFCNDISTSSLCRPSLIPSFVGNFPQIDSNNILLSFQVLNLVGYAG